MACYRSVFLSMFELYGRMKRGSGILKSTSHLAAATPAACHGRHSGSPSGVWEFRRCRMQVSLFPGRRAARDPPWFPPWWSTVEGGMAELFDAPEAFVSSPCHRAD